MSLASRRVLCNGSLPRTPFRELVAAAAGSGFDAITIWPHAWYRAQRHEGLAPGQMREILDAYGVAVTDVETAADWLVCAAGADAPATPVTPNHSRESLFEIGEALGADTLIAAHLTGGVVDRDQAIEGFGALCDDAERHGLRVALEAVPFTGIATVADAWAIVDGAGRSSGGVVFDVVHHARGGMEDAALLTVPAERYFAIQLADAVRAAPPDLLEEAMYHRLPPGDGDLPVAEQLRLLERHGVHAPIGPEVYRREWDEREPLEVAQVLGRATDAVLAR